MGLLDIFTGGKDEEAARRLREAESLYQGINPPTQEALTLPQLQAYVQAGLMTPAQAEAYLQGSNAYDTAVSGMPTAGRNAELAALNAMQSYATNPNLDPIAQAQIQKTINDMNAAVRGNRGAITSEFAERGVPRSLMEMAARNEGMGQDIQAANTQALGANAALEQRALQAMSGAGALGGAVAGQDWAQRAAQAAAQNEINQWNAANKTNVGLANAGWRQQGNLYNTQTAQDVANRNTGLGNERTLYNAAIPQRVFENQMGKAGAQAGIKGAESNLAQQQGQQEAGLWSGLIGGAATLGGDWMAGQAMGNAMKGMSQPQPAPAAGNYEAPPAPFAEGGKVPGRAEVPGDSMKNDKVPALLSPGEVVVPRSKAHDPNMVKDFIRNLPKKDKKAKDSITVHPDDVKNVLHSLARLRNGEK